ncbi:Gfo/Idh/MocA family protein [Kocuria rhizophila]|uniref:Gfo/Idh/MocA family protein n=1 Tax=Kocuria rhizophila TaxID=72000 RepID=UPI001EF6BBE3|nr:Gfo/Idh/MocA family oxidoreductase [Kocuria rhizophila]MCG7424043.1 Gfo/Idh/MocA family oxidoreductase [Kocuria rhizophila]
MVASIPNDRPVRFAVVGVGQISQQAFIPGLSRIEDAELAALVTSSPEKAEELGREYGVAAYSYEEYPALLESGDVDAVYVATPVFRHREFAEPALKAGIHVLLEKPMETSVEDAQAIVDAAEHSGATLMVAYRLHQEPGTVEMIEKVRDQKVIGDPRYFSSVFSQDITEENHRGHSGYWGGPIPDMGTYPQNMVRNLFHDEPVEVYAKGVRTPGRGFDFDDTVAVTLTFPGERIAQFTISYASESVERFTVAGTEGEISAEPCFGFGPDTGIEYTLTKSGTSESFAHDPVEQFGGQTQYFVDCLRNGVAPEPSGEEGMLDVRVNAAVLESLETGAPVSLEPRRRERVVTSEQVRRVSPADEPEDDELVDQVPQNG